MALDAKAVLDYSFEAAESLVNYQYHFVKINTSGQARLLDTAFETADGVLQNAPASGEEANVRMLGITKVVSNAALDEGTYVIPEFVSTSDCGKASAAVAVKGLIIGKVIDASSAEDDLCSIILLPSTGMNQSKTVVSTIATAGDVTFTAAQILGGLILRDPAGGARADLLPTAASIIAALQEVQVGDSFEFTVRNTADSSETITITTNAGLTLNGTMTIAQNNSKRFLALVTSSTAVTVYSLGTVVH